jgi:hypothetical protein
MSPGQPPPPPPGSEQCAASTGARWPNFRPNNSKEAPKNYLWPEKIGGRKWQNLAKSSRKEAGKYFYKHLGEKPHDIL